MITIIELRFLLQVYAKLSVFNDMYSLKIHQLFIYSFVARKQSLLDHLYY